MGWFQETPQKETTPFIDSPYAVAKLYSYWICVNYRMKHMECMPVMVFCLTMKALDDETLTQRSHPWTMKISR